ncbi:DUF4351 domain-containing protein [Eoetvoesiella caeni]|uniref:Uncharacterized protein DUF4351 n=1 Tax=Eoetvoesiella caeni TaxID=645616 RepID=A0A366HGA1_9BURK|nr:DUF4351 domain-containing protein [Eoetvoesiella caeni]MCI2807769.1 DUF4351 domain-containing protein [Eoetvoesiella caeni]NYT54226.1 DUF4351 domain-containing protein [Eoetvoesiella caeni]RBP41684.1 uncharacterized protein DUF4351 [Eoetvoesiella caeni]
MPESSTDYDSPWKEALDYYFEDFLRLLAPWLHTQIDWAHPPAFLDKELQALMHDAQNGRGRLHADKLVRVVSKRQQPFCILVHVEIQGGRITAAAVPRFGRRMFRYAWRIEDRYIDGIAGPDGGLQKMELVSLAVLTASRGAGTHLTYSWGNREANSGQFRFPVVHLSVWLDRWAELEKEAANNPFAAVVMAQLHTQTTSKDGPQRLASKTQIIRLLYRYRYSKKNILRLFRIIDWMMTLPAALEPAFEQAMATIEQEHEVTFVTSIERLGEKRGLEKGLEQGLEQGLTKGRNEGATAVLQHQLARKFGPLSEILQQRLGSATPAQLETWSLNILDAATLDDVFTE